MIQKIRTSRASKIIACYLSIQMITTLMAPTATYAATSGPSQPEFNSFTPIGTSDMVNLATGDFNYNIPIMDVGGYPINLAYDSGIGMDQEASWVGLGWNLNVGQITRNVRGIPDDFNGDLMTYENNIKDNVSVGVNGDIRFPFFGIDFINLGIGIGVQYNNYNGISFNTSFGPSFDISDRITVGMRLGSTSEGGVSVTPNISLHEAKDAEKENFLESLSGNVGITYDSQQGLSMLNIKANSSKQLFKVKNTPAFLNANLGFPMNDYLTFTPRNDLSFNNINLTLSAGLGLEIYGSEGPQLQLTGWASIQSLDPKEKKRYIPAFGYENTQNNITGQSLLDFNREKDRIVNENTKALAPVNYTYDSYIISGQGLQGSFRPHRSQVGYLNDIDVSSSGLGGSVGVEIGVTLLVHGGLDVEVNPSSSTSGGWRDSDNTILNKFKLEDYHNNQADYEPVYYKMSGELSADPVIGMANYQLYDTSPIKIGLGGTKFKRKTLSNYKEKIYNVNNVPSEVTVALDQVKRNQRDKRSNDIQKITNLEAQNNSLITYRTDEFVKGHHVAGYEIKQPDGSRYVYGETAYNTKKVEATFAVQGNNADCSTGIVTYNQGDNTSGNSKGRNHFFNKVTTPSYAHSYLLTSILSKDYEDLTDDGPTLDDLGSYTKITYTTVDDYKWRVPLGVNSGSYNAGLNTDKDDQMASYIYGEKELKYVERIETKTHIAIFELSPRDDAKGVTGENGGIVAKTMMKLDKIKLYSAPDYELNGSNAIPIKTAHFSYEYDLCPGAENSVNGKLTLMKLHFTYQNSYMGEYTPYKFNYINNKPYNLKGYDVWGNYKENLAGTGCTVTTGELSTTEFPYVEQNKIIADENTTSWALGSIDLPSGGKLVIEQESDDYQFVQDRKAMQMFMLAGVGNIASPAEKRDMGNILFDGNTHNKYLYVKLPDDLPQGYSPGNFVQDLLKNQYGGNGDIGTPNNELYFRILTNMTKNVNNTDYDYVTGYLLLDGNASYFSFEDEHYLSLPLQFQDLEGGITNSGQQVNPVSKAGWYFARKHLNRQAYGLPASPDINISIQSFVDVANSLISSLGSVVNIFGGPNKALMSKNIARTIIPEKSWVRLYEPFGFKYGGGSRVKKLIIHDEWDVMVNDQENPVYKNFYGQEYFYTDEEGKSSGVATFEPNGSKENPFVLPIYDSAVKIIAPKETNYIEMPLGESFYPAAQVTYSKVKVKSLNKNQEEGLTFNKHATGEVITDFYTSRDFPTISDFTAPTVNFDKTGILGNILKLKTRNHLTMSQGFVVHTNDMNGKMKSQRIRGEGQAEGEFISGVDYIYNTDVYGKLSNSVDVIHPDGAVTKEILGVQYDMINDFRKSKSKAEVYGADGNLGVIPLLFIPLTVPTILPNYMQHENVLKLTTTTKVVHSNGILREKIAYDLGARVATKNLIWDAQTGNVLFTEVNNEYGDNYYSFSYPAYWYYKNMGASGDNTGFKAIIEQVGGQNNHQIYHIYNETLLNPSDFLNLGDEIMVEGENDRLWVISIIGNNVKLMDRNGNWTELSGSDLKFKVIRSGKRNFLYENMASITTREIPFHVDGNGNIFELIDHNQWVGKKVLNTNAVLYNDLWNTLCEPDFPLIGAVEYDIFGNIVSMNEEAPYNPYLLNEKGDFRPQKSYAYLTDRNNGSIGYHPRNEGFFNNYTPFYKLGSQNLWEINETGWTFASEVTKFNAYGAEVENKDALGRYSAAIYDYSSTLPTAVAYNATYNEIGFDSFEYTGSQYLNDQNHFSFSGVIQESTSAAVDFSTAHTGNSSVKITGGGSLTYSLYSECDELPGCDFNTSINDMGQGVYVTNVYIGPQTGEYGILFRANNRPDKFEIYFDGGLVKASKYKGNNAFESELLNGGQPHTLNKYVYDFNSDSYVIEGSTESITVQSSELDLINGPDFTDYSLTFIKTTNTEYMTVRAISPASNNTWEFSVICIN